MLDLLLNQYGLPIVEASLWPTEIDVEKPLGNLTLYLHPKLGVLNHYSRAHVGEWVRQPDLINDGTSCLRQRRLLTENLVVFLVQMMDLRAYVHTTTKVS